MLQTTWAAGGRHAWRLAVLLWLLPAAQALAEPRGAGLSGEPTAQAPRLPFAPATPASAGRRSGQSWEVRTSDLRIDRTLERWAQAAGWRVQWDAARHVEIGAPTTFHGSFEAAVRAVLGTPGIRLSEFPLEGCIYPNEPPLLRITRQGEQLLECPREYSE